MAGDRVTAEHFQGQAWVLGLWLGCSPSGPLHPLLWAAGCQSCEADEQGRGPGSTTPAQPRSARLQRTQHTDPEPEAPARRHLNSRPRRPSPRAAEWWGDSSHSAADRAREHEQTACGGIATPSRR